jgi:multidrug efflux pump subunit AcrB
MSFTAFFILGIITYMNIPVSLLPDIAIPEITVHIMVTKVRPVNSKIRWWPLVRQQLLQVGKLSDIHSETRDGSAVIYLKFDYGTDTELAICRGQRENRCFHGSYST